MLGLGGLTFLEAGNLPTEPTFPQIQKIFGGRFDGIVTQTPCLQGQYALEPMFRVTCGAWRMTYVNHVYQQFTRPGAIGDPQNSCTS